GGDGGGARTADGNRRQPHFALPRQAARAARGKKSGPGAVWRMSGMDYTEEEIAERLRLLPPAPTAWVRAACELPRARELMDGIVARAEADAEYRRTVLADLEAALRLAGVEPATPLLDELRRQLDPRR